MRKFIIQKLFFFIFCFISVLLIFPAVIQATENILFEDNFENGKKSDWEEYMGLNGGWTVKNGEYIGTVTKNCSGDFPSYSLVGNINWTNYSFEVRMKGTEGVDKKILFRYNSNMEKTYDLNLINNNILGIGKQHPSGSWVKTTSFNNSSNTWYKIKVVLKNENIKIYIDDVLQFDFNDTDNPILNGKVGLQIWPGYYAGCGGRTTVHYDDIIIKDGVSFPTPTPTSTLLQPIVLLPGLGSSWNHEDMILDIEKSQSEWYMMPGIKIYDGLIETLKNAGYETEGENKNLFVFNYNWTKPVNSITEDFKTYIENVVNPLPEEKIDLLGHSLGGLVARNYIQNNQENSVDQLITLGSPLKGVPSVYYLWEGGNLSKFLPTWQRIGIGLLFHLRKPNFSTNMEALRTVTPVFNDLLPTFNYLKQNGNEKELSQMSEKNDWLINLNNSPPSYLLSVTNNFLGTFSNSTTRWINVTDPNWLDRLLGFWSDGKPSGEELDEGDRVVLSESASLNGATVTYIENINHQELVTSSTSQQKIMEAFNLSPSSISTISTDLNYNSSLVFQIASPATIAITDPNGNLVGDGDDKLIIITDPLSGDYQINLAGTTNGPYDLHIGQILNDKDFWTTTSSSINEGDEISYKIAFNPSAPLENPIIDQTGEIYIETAQNQISNLREEIKQQSLHPFMKRLILIQLNRTESLLNKDKFEKAIISLYRFRLTISFWQRTARLGKDRGLYFKNKTQEIINNLEDVYVIYETNKERIYNQRRLKREILLAQKIFDKIENKLQKLSKKGVINPDYGALYLLSQTKLNKAKNSSSYEAHINILSAKLLSREGFFLFK